MKENPKPSAKRPALLQFYPFTPVEAFAKVVSTDKGLLSGTKDNIVVPLKISSDLITTFLARVHPFTALGLEAQGYAYSLNQVSVVKYLVLLPQINDTELSEAERKDFETRAFEIFRKEDPDVDVEKLCYRGRLHTRSGSLLTPKDLH